MAPKNYISFQKWQRKTIYRKVISDSANIAAASAYRISTG
jgi:hypothetical protein